MVLARRVAKLEDGLDPEAAVIHWLDEAHRFPTMAAYAEWLVEQPEEAHPLMRFPQQVEDATRQRLRRTYRDVRRGVRRAVFDAVLRVQLVIALNVEAMDIVRVHGMRHVASHYRMRELAFRESLAETDEVAAQADRLEHAWESWGSDAGSLLTTLHSRRVACERLEARYLGGHAAMFPETRELTAGLIAEVEHWHGLVAETYCPEADSVAELRDRAEELAHVEAGRIEERAIASAHWGLGEYEAARYVAYAAVRGRTDT